ncbi:hypothetical protein JVU11DRAFT_7194 [Chiua virens]|nr:hypothetical protein JVU11DRAFT_7194 [Chiua virens]
MTVDISPIAFSGLILLSGLPVARAELECDLHIHDTNVCSWINEHEIVLVIISVVGGIVLLLSLLGCCLSSARSQQDPGPMVQPQLARPDVSYPFSAPNVGWQSSQTAVPAKEPEWATVDLSKTPSVAPELRGPAPVYNNGYAV